jgi:F0F1-type ATP synthase delta subunit
MNKRSLRVSNKYAKAFFNLYGTTLDDKDFWLIKNVLLFLSKSKKVLIYFNWSTTVDRQNLIDIFLQRFKLKSDFSKLLFMLQKKKRVFLLPEVLHCILDLYLVKNNKLFFELQSYPLLSSSQAAQAVEFLKNTTGKDILYISCENKNLIAGLKMQSGRLLYEDTIKCRLQKVCKKLVRQN